MRISFSKITANGSSFETSLDKLEMRGELKKVSKNLVSCKAQLQGETEHQCDRCAESMLLNINEKLELFFHDGVYDGQDENLDIIEFFDEEIDFVEVINSEVASIKSGYFYCATCSE